MQDLKGVEDVALRVRDDLLAELRVLLRGCHDVILQSVGVQAQFPVTLEAERSEDRGRHPSRLHDEDGRATRDSVLPPRVHEGAVDPAAPCLGQDGAAHQSDSFRHVDGTPEADRASFS